MSDHVFIQYCSPTLAGLKTGNMFTVDYDSPEELNEELCRLNERFRPKGLRIVLLRSGRGRALVYLYRPGALTEDMRDCQAAEILREMGYTPENVNRCVAKLAAKMRGTEHSTGFPHEVGLFLGYPPEDVKGFMENGGGCCKEVGFWKVYGDEDAARDKFRRYRRCQMVYREQFSRGRSLDQLIVSDRQDTGYRAE